MNTHLFDSFATWYNVCEKLNIPLYKSVIEFEQATKNKTEKEILKGLSDTYTVMKEAVKSGLTENMRSLSGMIDNGGKKVMNCKKTVLSVEFQILVARTLAAKEVNSCMGRVVAAPTAGASGILPGILITLQEIHDISDKKIKESLLIAAGTALILEKRASIAGAVGGCQAETGSAAAMAAAAITYCLNGNHQQILNAIAFTIQSMLGLVCDPIAGLVEVPCVVRNATAAAIANTAAQMALAGVDPIVPPDECADAMGEIGQSMETRYKETALGGLATTPTANKVEKNMLIQDKEQQQA